MRRTRRSPGVTLCTAVARTDDDYTTIDGATAASSVDRIGPYRLLRQIGRGGMGTVYLAVRDDDAFHKQVAIKVLRRGTDTDAIVRRFKHERQILAGLDHPCIAGLFDGGTTPDGLPYFAMEYVEGQSITEYCESRRLDTTARLELFRRVCSAVQHAHQNLVIHRDIKPANVLVTADGTPKLLDFGIAKLLNAELSGHAPTIDGGQHMTPEYASPEQVLGQPVTTATDVYSLGMLLYELLTGRRPYRLTSRAPSEIARVVCESVPERPSTAVTRTARLVDLDDVPTVADAPTETRPQAIREHTVRVERLRKRLAGDLDNIVLKALSKEPARRYASVDQFSEDVRRHLAGLPVIARKETWSYRAAKFVGRNRVAVASAVLVFLALVAGIIATAWQARVARRERAVAEQRFDDVRKLANALLFDLHDQIRDLPGSTPARQLMVGKALEYLDRLAGAAGDRADLRRELAAAYLRVGDVQGRPLTPNLGDTAGAAISYRKAISLYESIAAAPGRGPQPADALSREQGIAYSRMSDVLAVTGDSREALAFARKGLAVLQEGSGGGQAPPELRREIAAAQSRLGDLLATTGDVKAALEARKTALATMEALAAVAPNDADNLRQLGVAWQKLGNTLGNPNAPNVGDHAASLAALDKASGVFRRAVELHPLVTTFTRNLAVVDSNSADVLLALKRPGEALQRMRRAFTAFRSLSDADPANVAARNDLAITHAKLGLLLDAQGEYADALREFERSLAIHDALVAADPANFAAKAETASDHNLMATTLAKVGNRAASLSHHGDAVRISRELSAADPDDIERRMNLALALLGRGDALATFARAPRPPTREADLSAAVRSYTEGIDLLLALQRLGALEGTDVQTLTNAQAELARMQQELAAR